MASSPLSGPATAAREYSLDHVGSTLSGCNHCGVSWLRAGGEPRSEAWESGRRDPSVSTIRIPLGGEHVGTPRYQQIADALRTRVLAGEPFAWVAVRYPNDFGSERSRLGRSPKCSPTPVCSSPFLVCEGVMRTTDGANALRSEHLYVGHRRAGTVDLARGKRTAAPALRLVAGSAPRSPSPRRSVARRATPTASRSSRHAWLRPSGTSR